MLNQNVSAHATSYHKPYDMVEQMPDMDLSAGSRWYIANIVRGTRCAALQLNVEPHATITDEIVEAVWHYELLSNNVLAWHLTLLALQNDETIGTLCLTSSFEVAIVTLTPPMYRPVTRDLHELLARLPPHVVLEHAFHIHVTCTNLQATVAASDTP